MEIKHKSRHHNPGAFTPVWQIILLSIFVFFSTTSFALENNSYRAKVKLYLNMNNVRVIDVLDEIEKSSDFYFLFNQKFIDVDRRVNLDVEGTTIDDVLELLFINTKVKHKINNQIIVLTTEDKDVPKPTVQQKGKKISGTIVDEDGQPLPGASVVVKGTSKGTVSDINGKYSISNIVESATLVFSFVGVTPQEVNVGNQETIDIRLNSDAIGLDEIIAIGYGVQKRSVVTGAISSLSADDMLQSRPTNAAQALQGRASGVVLSSASAQPGSSPKISIRGIGTNGNSNPLIIVDGLQMSDLNDVNPNDIESMEVLKDATSSAIYGARAANGVILVTTKKAKKGQTSIGYNGFYGVQNAYNLPDLMNTDQFLEMTMESFENGNMTYPEGRPTENEGIDSDWLDAITGPAPVQEHNITVTSGSEKSTILFSLGYRDQDGIIGGNEGRSYFKRYSARLNAEIEATNRITVGANLNYVNREKKGVGTGTSGNANIVSFGLIMPPTTPVYDDVNGDEDGYGISTSEQVPQNPLSFIDKSSDNFNSNASLYGNTYAKINLFEGLVFKTDFALQVTNYDERKYSPSYVHSAHTYNLESSISQKMKKTMYWQWENTLNYTKKINDHSFTALLGYSASKSGNLNLEGSRKNLPNEAQTNSNFWYLDAGDLSTSVNSGIASVEHSLASVFSRLSYNYKEKYMGEVVVRRDGSSNFGDKNKYAIFPGFSVGWNISNEDFWYIDKIDRLKLRASWGQNGNESIGAFNYTSIIANDQNAVWGENGTIITGSSPQSLVNSDVKWETSEQFNVGVDLNAFGSKLRVGLDYFNKQTKDLLFQRNIEAVRGNVSPYYNVGSVTNNGFEVQVGYNFNVSKVRFSVDANASYLKNKVTNVGNENGYEEGGEWNSTLISRMEEGMPMGYFYGYKIDGIFQNLEEIEKYTDESGNLTYPNASPGDFKWTDTNNDGVISTDDRTKIGNPWPKWIYGLNLSANWEGWDIGVFVNGKAKVDVFSAPYKQGVYGNGNMPTFFMDRWTKEGDQTSIPRFDVSSKNQNKQKASEFWINDASFLKISNIEIGYTFPKAFLKKANISNLRIFGSIDNAAIFTNYPYIDPDVGNMNPSKGVLNTGIDFGKYPEARTFRAGMTLKL